MISKKVRRTLTQIGLGLSVPLAGHAQDFYSGYRGPRRIQLDTYVQQAEQVTGAVVPKLFLGDLLLATPTTIDTQGLTAQGVNIGYIIDPKKGLGVIAAAGLFRDDRSKLRKVIPQIYATMEKGPLSLDTEVAYGRKSHAAITAGTAVVSRLRLGVSGGLDGKELSWQGIARYEVRSDHGVWVQIYGGKDVQGKWVTRGRVAINF